METMILAFVILTGLVLGSFFNVVIYRLPRGLNLSRPPSACPGCGSRIKPYDNVPVLSYLVLRGKCRRCGRRISPIYPTVEILTALGFALVFFHSGQAINLPFVAGALFASGLIVLGFIDAAHQILPDVITLPGFVLALAYSFFRPDLKILGALIGAAVGAGFLLLVYGVYFLVRKKEGLGLGDVTMMLMVGAFLGWGRTLLVLILASFAGALFGLYLISRKGKDAQFALPFGSFIAPAAFVAMIWGDQIIRAYMSLYKR